MEWRFVTAIAAGLAGCSAVALLAVVVLTPGAVPESPPATPLLIARSEPIAPAVQPAPAIAEPAPPADAAIRLPPPSAAPPPAAARPPEAERRDGLAGSAAGAARNPPAAPATTAALPPTFAPEPAPPPPVRLAPPPHKPRPPVDHRYDGVLTVAEIGRIKASLRLSPDQEPYWPPVATILRELGRQQMAQVDAGQKPDFNMSGEMTQRFYYAASPLLQTLREDQKEEVRKRARMMGLENFASFI